MSLMDARQVSLSIGDGGAPESFLPLGGLREAEAEWQARPPAAATLADGPWSRALAGAGGRSLSLRGSGLFEHSPGEARLLLAVQTGLPVRLRIDFGGVQQSEGLFHVTRYRRRLSRDTLVEAEVTLESSGEVVTA